MLYGANHYSDIATVALLIPEGGQYTIDIFSPDFNYRTIKGLSVTDAVKEAEMFVDWHPEFARTQTSRIIDGNGQVVGYEVRALPGNNLRNAGCNIHRSSLEDNTKV